MKLFPEILRAPDEIVAAVEPSGSVETPAPQPAAAEAPPAAEAPAVTAEPAKPESPPSLLAAADAAKRDSAPKAADTPPPADAGAKPEKPSEGAPDAAKPEEAQAKPEGAPDAAKDAQAEEPPAPPTYDAYQMPEAFQADEKRVGEFNGILGKFELATKADHAATQALGQELVNFHAQEVMRVVQERDQYQRDVWNRLNETRINELKSDPEIGGNRVETTLGNAKYVIEQFGGSKDEQAKLLAEMDNGGVSNSVRLIRFLNNIFERYREPTPVPPNPPSLPKGQGRNWYA